MDPPKTLISRPQLDAALADEEKHARKVPKATIEPIEPEKPKVAGKRPERAPPTFRQSVMRFVNAMVLSLIIFYFFSTEFRTALGAGADAVLSPLIGFGGQLPIVSLLLAGLVTSTISTVIAHVFTDYVRQARMQRQNAALSKASFAAMRSGNTRKLERVREAQKKVQGGNVDLMWTPMKIMGYSMLIIFVIFAWLGTFLLLALGAPGNEGKLYFAVPWAGRVNLQGFSVLPHWILLYSLLAIPFSSVLRRLLRYFAFKKRLAALEAAEAVQVSP